MEATFDSLVQRLASGWTAADNVLKARVEPPDAGDIAELPHPGSKGREELAELGYQAMAQGRVGLVIIAGGMATRFNWDRPKGVFPIYQGISFLGWKLRWARQVAGDCLPVYLMTSFHTCDEIARHLKTSDYFGCAREAIRLFQQYRFRRLQLSGDFFHDPGGLEDYAAPGHGDFPRAFRESGLLAEFLGQGGQTLLFSNVDNLGASVDPEILGWHLQSGSQMTAEVAGKVRGDKGGAPARVDGRPQLVEGFAFPAEFDQDQIAVFNTATYCFDARALDRDFDLPWYLVEKKVCGQAVLQFEHLAGDLSRELDCRFLAVERDDRFIPVKSQTDLPRATELIAAKALRLSQLQSVHCC